MATAIEIIDELKGMGSASIKKVLMNHGAREPFYGVKIGDMQKIVKRIKKDYQLALDLYASGISDAMYLAGLIADDMQMTKKDLQTWVEGAYWHMLSGFTVPWVAAGGRFGREMAIKWMKSKNQEIAAAGWCTYSGLVAIKDDADLDLDEIAELIDRCRTTIHDQPDRVRYCMNGFVIAVGTYVASLTDAAVAAAQEIGEVHVDMGETACQVPDAMAVIKKVKDRKSIGKKRKTIKC